jgi:hypothetical protein
MRVLVSCPARFVACFYCPVSIPSERYFYVYVQG